MNKERKKAKKYVVVKRIMKCYFGSLIFGVLNFSLGSKTSKTTQRSVK